MLQLRKNLILQLNLVKMMLKTRPIRPDFVPITTVSTNYAITQSQLEQAHMLCPDKQLLIDSNIADRNEIGLVMPATLELLREGGLTLSDKIVSNVNRILNGISEPTDSIMAAHLVRYFNLCEEKLPTQNISIERGTLTEVGIDYEDNQTQEYLITGVRESIRHNKHALESLIGLYHDHLLSLERDPELWAAYKAKLSPKLEDRLCDSYQPEITIKGITFQDIQYALRVAVITYRPEKGDFLEYAKQTVEKIGGILKRNERLDREHPTSIAKVFGGWILEHRIPLRMAIRMARKFFRRHESKTENIRLSSLELCRTLYRLQKEPIPVGYQADKNDLKQALTHLERAEKIFNISYYFEGLNWAEMESVYELPENVLIEIQEVIIKKIRKILAKSK